MSMSETQNTPRKGGRPSKGNHPSRSAGRIGPVWDECVARAAEEGQTMTAFVEAAITRELRIRRNRDVSRVAAASAASRDKGTVS